MRSLLLLVTLLVLPAPAQDPPAGDDLDDLVRRYVAGGEKERASAAEKLRQVPALSRKESRRWRARILKLMARTTRRLRTRGTGYLYDEDAGRGKYIVAGGSNRAGLIIGLHGGGVGSADCRGAASAWRGAVQSAHMVGLFPEAIEATEAAWGDEKTVRFVLDLLAAARCTFRFDQDRVYVVGHSMGGYGAWTLCGRYADRFAGGISFAGAPTPVFAGEEVRRIEYGVLPNLRNLAFWSFHSADDPRVPIVVTRYAASRMKELCEQDPGGYRFHFEEVDGRGHAFPARGAGPALKWVTGTKRDPHPRRVVWQAFDRRPDHRYWVAWKRPEPGYTVKAEWDGGSEFRFTGDAFPEDLALLLDDSMTDLDKPVRVLFDGGAVFEGTVERRLLTLLRTAERGDPGLVFSARVPLERPDK